MAFLVDEGLKTKTIQQSIKRFGKQLDQVKWDIVHLGVIRTFNKYVDKWITDENIEQLRLLGKFKNIDSTEHTTFIQNYIKARIRAGHPWTFTKVPTVNELLATSIKQTQLSATKLKEKMKEKLNPVEIEMNGQHQWKHTDNLAILYKFVVAIGLRPGDPIFKLSRAQFDKAIADNDVRVLDIVSKLKPFCNMFAKDPDNPGTVFGLLHQLRWAHTEQKRALAGEIELLYRTKGTALTHGLIKNPRGMVLIFDKSTELTHLANFENTCIAINNAQGAGGRTPNPNAELKLLRDFYISQYLLLHDKVSGVSERIQKEADFLSERENRERAESDLQMEQLYREIGAIE